jgi:hypothetical protein
VALLNTSYFFYFIWDGKPEKIKRNTLISDFEDGGLKMIHLQQFNAYLKISWIKRFLSNNIFETSIIFFLKFRSGIELRSREKSIPSSLKLDTDQSNLKSGQRI